ncbi:alpha/beta fold hydrolase [Dokdonella sp.]|uniref:alpha/beta hydrolase n=1 Tax=Dokdonella sp. TaxID=2291710 RepID=UPI0025B9684E|nr:alpha/beta fold hydrolase [Dokdonella sp.]MBX3692625.1 alpha/beta fold hydrolase [Dokdonella sp.]MCW5567369.1 alpha/beta fold hydrolase [Dokdonella sp.]
MKKVLITIILVILALCGGGWLLYTKLVPPPAEAATLNPRHAELATRFLDLLDAARYEDALAMANDEVRAALDAKKLGDTWEILPKQLGARSARSELRGEIVAGKQIVTSTLSFPMMSLDARVFFDEADRISGFRLVPAQKAPAPVELEQGTNWREIEFAAGPGHGALPGTLTLPAGNGPFAAVVLVHGSGAHDRDETIGPNKPFRDIAHGLASHGIAVLRYEKRTRAEPVRFSGKAFTVDDEVTLDVIAAAAALRTRSDIDPARVFVAGHSLGAMIAPRIATRDTRLAGLILLAAPARALEDVVPQQIRYMAALDGKSDADIETVLAPIEQQVAAVKALDAGVPDTAPLLLGLPASYWRSLAGYDPLAVTRSIPQPLLVLQGGRDYQVTPADDFARWREAFADEPRVQLREYPLLSHLFMPGGDPPGPKDYSVEGHVDATVIDDIAAWIGAH